MKEIPTAQQLQELLDSAQTTPDDKGWGIYRYLNASIGKDLPSDQARSLLLAYLKLENQRPSVLHSQMLAVAVKMADAYHDFKLPGFLKLWGLGNLRPDDLKPYHTTDGKMFRPLAEKLAIALVRYAVKHPDDLPDPQLASWAESLAAGCGFLPAADMVAVKVFESVKDGRKIRMVKLVGADGAEMSADWRMFNCKPWEIAGRMFTVLPRRSEKSGNLRVDTAALSPNNVGDVFGRVIGYVDRFDSNHKQYHIFDNKSRHFVAESPLVRISVGNFVWFAPIIPAEDKFKSAIVLSVEPQESAVGAFGITTGQVGFVDTEKGYFSFYTPDGTRGSGSLALLSTPPVQRQQINVIAFMRRGKDGEKRLHAAMVLQ